VPATRPSARYTIYRCKRPPRKRKGVELEVPAIVRTEGPIGSVARRARFLRPDVAA
jgi:hypothetical protein